MTFVRKPNELLILYTSFPLHNFWNFVLFFSKFHILTDPSKLHVMTMSRFSGCQSTPVILATCPSVCAISIQYISPLLNSTMACPSRSSTIGCADVVPTNILSPVLEGTTFTMEWPSCTVTILKGRAARSIPLKSYNRSVVSDKPTSKRDPDGSNVMLLGRELDCADKVMLDVIGSFSSVAIDGSGFGAGADFSISVSLSFDWYLV
mmetsp:Transcript_10157/g.15242  ORF Transcript_10157/g.15242 Transcript_10157/m.15242 type:complete len:206 (+) Transcript_10157:401-1018(+)